MKKLIFFICCVLCLSGTEALAQRSASFISPDVLFREGKNMYDNRNYAGCISKMLEFKKTASDIELVQEADFLIAASSFYMGKESAGLDLKYYLDNYPVNRHRDEAYFMIGSSHYAQGDYPIAIYWFDQANIDNLSTEQQEDYAYRLGYSYLKTQKRDDAKRLFSLLRNNSDNYRWAATYYLAYISYTEGDYRQATVLFNTVRDQPEFRPDVLYYLTQIHFAEGRYQQTITEGNALLTNYPSFNFEYNTEINRLIGLSYFQEGNYQRTVEYLTRYASRAENPNSGDLYVLGLAYFNLNNYPKAIEYWSLSNPGNDALGQNTNVYLGQAYLKQGNTNQALMAFQTASRLDFDPQAKEAALYNYAMLLHQNSVSAFGESVTVLENFLNTYPNSMYADRVNDALVDVYLTTKNYETALASIAKIRNPGNQIRQAQQKIYYYLGTVAFTNGEYNEAIRHFTQAINAGNYAAQERAEALYWRGESYYKLGNFNNAATDYQAYLNTGNRSRDLELLALYNLAYCSFNQQQYRAAENAFRRFINSETRRTPVLADAYVRLGDCYFHNRQFSEAENAYNQAVAVVPSMGDYALFQKGYVQGLQRNYPAKIAQMDRLISEFPQSPYVPEALYEKGRSYVLLENTPAAIQTYQLLWDRFPESNSARKAGLQIGLLYFNANQPQQAAEAYKRVIAKYPGSEEARVAIDDLRSVYIDLNDVTGYADYVRSLGGAVRFDVTEQDSLTYIAAERFFLRNEFRQAQTAMQNYLQSFPTGAFSVNARYYLAQAYYQDNNHAAAKQEFERVLEAGNHQFTEEALVRLAELYYLDKEYERALLLYERLQNTAASRTNQDAGSLGIVLSAAQLNRPTLVVTAANRLLRDASINPNRTGEVTYHRAKAFKELGETALFEQDLQELSKDTRTAFGAEAKYLLAQNYFDTNQTARAKETVLEYIRQGTPHAYWLARSFILMSDIFASEGDRLQARQYLESLQTNYTGSGDDIQIRINERINNL
jgi:tetratricopeptide (TPR) repeat protein